MTYSHRLKDLRVLSEHSNSADEQNVSFLMLAPLRNLALNHAT